ncbi:MAG: Hsp20/alpha crystallin family protein [Clostridia bacterium]|nr:Hsp20/alpha crystallin family protein [Clostridia bacterium]
MFDLSPIDRIGPRHDLFSTGKEIDDFERRFFGKPLPTMRTDIRETDEAYVLEAELPGFQVEDIRVSIRDQVLTVSAERSELSKGSDEDSRFLHRERSVGSIRRSFDISGIRSDEIRAAFRDGILSVTLPKPTHPQHMERDITIDDSIQ